MASLISVPQFAELQAGPHRFQLIDVRSSSEYSTGHIPGAENMRRRFSLKSRALNWRNTQLNQRRFRANRAGRQLPAPCLHLF
jgi:rhodanese-related sulfurtransferase